MMIPILNRGNCGKSQEIESNQSREKGKNYAMSRAENVRTRRQYGATNDQHQDATTDGVVGTAAKRDDRCHGHRMIVLWVAIIVVFVSCANCVLPSEATGGEYGEMTSNNLFSASKSLVQQLEQLIERNHKSFESSLSSNGDNISRSSSSSSKDEDSIEFQNKNNHTTSNGRSNNNDYKKSLGDEQMLSERDLFNQILRLTQEPDSTQLLSTASMIQKFHPNGRYGRRSVNDFSDRIRQEAPRLGLHFSRVNEPDTTYQVGSSLRAPVPISYMSPNIMSLNDIMSKTDVDDPASQWPSSPTAMDNERQIVDSSAFVSSMGSPEQKTSGFNYIDTVKHPFRALGFGASAAREPCHHFRCD